MVDYRTVGEPPSAASRVGALVGLIDEARRAGDWVTALDVYRDNMVTLIAERLRWSRELFAAAPEDLVTDPSMVLARDFVLGRSAGTTGPGLGDDSPSAARALAAMTRVMELRALGRFDDAEQVVRDIEPVLAAVDELDDRIALARLQFGILRLLRGDFTAALEDLGTANLLARQTHSQFVIRNSAGDLALVHALRGNLRTADQWLAMFDEAQVDPDGEFEHTARVGGIVARALVALARLRVDEAAAAVDQLRDVDVTEELWVFVVAAQVFLCYVQGRAMAGLALLDEAEVSHGPSAFGAGFARRILSSARIELLLATGQAIRARAQTRVGQRPAHVAQHRPALVSLVIGDLAEAIPMADAMAWSPSASVRTRAEGFVVGAVARWRHGSAGTPDYVERAEAHQMLARAVELCEPEGLLETFAVVPLDELRAIAAAGPSAERIGRFLAAPELAAVPPFLPTQVTVVELSERELAVLAELATTSSFDVVAKRLFVSTNTVKTQARKVYRKLGVHSREEALSVAYREGLLLHRGTFGATETSGQDLLA